MSATDLNALKTLLSKSAHFQSFTKSSDEGEALGKIFLHNAEAKEIPAQFALISIPDGFRMEAESFSPTEMSVTPMLFVQLERLVVKPDEGALSKSLEAIDKEAEAIRVDLKELSGVDGAVRIHAMELGSESFWRSDEEERDERDAVACTFKLTLENRQL